MSTRLLHILVPAARRDQLAALLRDDALRHWQQPLEGAEVQVTALVPGPSVERVVDRLEQAFASAPSFAIVVTPVEAFIPAGHAVGPPWTPRPPNRLEAFFTRDRLSTEELYDDLEDGTRLTRAYVVFVVTSALIAALGMRSGQTAVVIGAMVIAPLLAPAMAMAMAATVGDRALGWRALGVMLAGTAVAFLATVGLGLVLPVDPTVHELALRTHIGLGDVVLALASGAAGVMAFSRGLSVSLVGVMIAVALVPPLAAAGMFTGAGEGRLAANALLLFATNLVCINVAGILTLLVQGLSPKNWRLTGGLLALWIGLMLTLAALIFVRFGG